jgi:hypothetical protein
MSRAEGAAAARRAMSRAEGAAARRATIRAEGAAARPAEAARR